METTTLTRSQTSGKPYNVVNTFKGNAANSRAFAWCTDVAGDGTVLELIPEAGGQTFEGSGVIRFSGKSTPGNCGKGTRTAFVHIAEATGLIPGTTYQYRVGSGSEEGWSEEGTFTTAAVDPTAFSFIHVTDSQCETRRDFELFGDTLSAAFNRFPDAKFIVHGGDLTENPEDERGWDHFFEQAKPWLTRVPLMPVVGNHDGVGKKPGAYLSHFSVPDKGTEQCAPGTGYSFDYGNVHFVVLNTESNLKKQTEWLRADLSATGQKWIIAAMHRPAYGGSRNESTGDWVKLFDEFHVDLVLQGHNHEYSRSYPLKDGKVTKAGKGTVYVVTNASGSKFNPKKADKYYHAAHFQNYKQMFAGITVTGATLEFAAYDLHGNKLDELVLRH